MNDKAQNDVMGVKKKRMADGGATGVGWGGGREMTDVSAFIQTHV